MLFYRARAGVTGLVADLSELGMELVDVPSSVLVGNKYTVGPAWTGAEFATIQAAVDQAAIDGHSTSVAGTNVTFQLYSGTFVENVVIPETLPRFNFEGFCSGSVVGTTITGTFTVNQASANAQCGFSNVIFNGAFLLNQPVVTGSTILRAQSCSFLAFTLASTSAGCSFIAWNCRFQGAFSATCRQMTWYLCTCTLAPSVSAAGQVVEMLYCTLFLGVLVTAASSFRARFSYFQAPLVLTGCVSVDLLQNRIYYSTAPAVTENATGFSEVSGNRFYATAGGAASPAYRKSGASVGRQSGNTFEANAVYPFFEVLAGTMAAGQGNDQLQLVTTRAGSFTLTPAEVGSQRKTTIAKVNGGGVVTLPLASSVEPGCTIVVKDLNGSATASPFTVAPQGADLIDGGGAVPIALNYSAVTFQQMASTDWAVIGRYL